MCSFCFIKLYYLGKTNAPFVFVDAKSHQPFSIFIVLADDLRHSSGAQSTLFPSAPVQIGFSRRKGASAKDLGAFCRRPANHGVTIPTGEGGNGKEAMRLAGVTGHTLLS